MSARTAAVVLLLASLGAAEDKPKTLDLPATAFPDLKADGEAKPPTPPKDSPDDGTVVKLAKAKLRALAATRKTVAGRFGLGFGTERDEADLTSVGAELAAAADRALSDPKDRVPWHEYRVRVAKAREELTFDRAKQKIESEKKGYQGDWRIGYELPLASAERLEAEIALLKLKEKIGK